MAEEESFKVTDRRGRARDSSATDAFPQPPPPAESPPVGAPSTHPRDTEPPQDGPDLTGVFVMFASTALIHLGEAPDPMTGQSRIDLEQAREAIDILLLLRSKTESNRTEEESRLLEEILYDLHLRFVRATERPRQP
jgi:hypothetical protein